MNRRHDRPSADDRGEVSAQSVILVPALLVMCLLVVQASLWFHAANVAESAATRGAAIGSLRVSSAGAASAAARAALAENGVAGGGVNASVGAEFARVTVSVPVSQLVPFFPGSVTHSVIEPRERFVPEPQR